MNAKPMFEMYDAYIAELQAQKEAELAEKLAQQKTKAEYSPEPEDIPKKKEEVKSIVQPNISEDKRDNPDDDGGIGG